MFDRTNAFEAGRLYLEEVNRLIESPNLVTDHERMILLAQMDSLCGQMEKVIRSCGHPPSRTCAILARLLSADGIERMVALGIDPRIVRGVRSRRYETFLRYWRTLRSQFAADSRRARRLCAQNREWPMFLREHWRHVEGEYLLLLLYRSALLYRAGLRVRIGSAVYRLQSLIASLPPRGRCLT